MGRYSPTIRQDPGGPLDFSPLAAALSDLQDNRLRRRQQKLWEDREAEDRRVQGERERVAAEERANDVRRRGGVKLLEAPIGKPTLRDVTPAQESRVPQSLGGGALRPMLPRSTGGDYRPEGTGRYLEQVDGEAYMVDPLQPARMEERKREILDAPKQMSEGIQRERMLRDAGLHQGDDPASLGKMDRSLFGVLVESRQGQRSLQQAETALRQQATFYGIPGADRLPAAVLAAEVKRVQQQRAKGDDFAEWKRRADYTEGQRRSRPGTDADEMPAFLTPNAVGKMAADMTGKAKTDDAGDPIDANGDGKPDVVTPNEAAGMASDKVKAAKRAAASEEYTLAANAYKVGLARAGSDPAEQEKVKAAYLAARAAIEQRYGSLQ